MVGRPIAGLSTTRVLIAAAVLVIVAGAVWVLVIGDGSEPTDPISTTAAQSKPSAAPEAKPTGGRKARDGGDVAEPEHRGSSQSSKVDGASAGTEQADPIEGPDRCPQGLSPAECQALAGALKQSPGRRVKKGECPPGLSRSECKTLAEALEQPAGTEITEAGCPPELTHAQCQAVAEGSAYLKQFK